METQPLPEPPDWNQADRAYQLHHRDCTQCQSAGMSPGAVDRCATGSELWTRYENAGPPPHFLWLRKSPKSKGA